MEPINSLEDVKITLGGVERKPSVLTIEFFKTFGLEGGGWSWWILLPDKHPWAVGNSDSKTFQDAVEDFKVKGIEWLDKLVEAEKTWAKGVLD